ncbi:MAG: SDR family NAD(P)-dependent oxidoreductase [Acidimicrobiales bacterium]
MGFPVVAAATGDFTGHTVIVTGGAKGIGYATTAAFAANGANIVIADLTAADDAARKIAESTGAATLAIPVDVGDEIAVESMAAESVRRFGSVDILVNTAGLFSSLTPKPFHELTASEWREVLGVNVTGAFLCAKAVYPFMRDQGQGRIINVASAAPMKGIPFLLHYVASKGALLAMTKALARELGPSGVLVNAVAPGFTQSDGVIERAEVFAGISEISRSTRALQREEHPHDIVGAVLFLAGPGSSFITGQTIVVDGGSHLH